MRHGRAKSGGTDGPGPYAAIVNLPGAHTEPEVGQGQHQGRHEAAHADPPAPSPSAATSRSRPDGDGAADLIPTLGSAADIALAEHANIEAATRWALGEHAVAEPLEVLTPEFSDGLHQRMFGDVWRWAGRRNTERTRTGILPERITPRLESLFADARWWHEQHLHTPAERAVKLYRGLLQIHAYPGGNRRHARLLADLYVHVVGAQPVEWDESHDVGAATRSDLTALQDALDLASRDLALARRRSTTRRPAGDPARPDRRP